jgi:hypothetical protein
MRYMVSVCGRRRGILFLLENHTSGKLVFLILLIVAGIILCFTDQAFGQLKEEVEKEIERTDKVIERAKEAVTESGNTKAQTLLDIAINLQGNAKQALDGRRFGLAVKLTLQAREKAFEAIGITKRAEENENLVLKAIERTDQIIAKAKEIVFLTEDQRASPLLDAAIKNQHRAKEFYNEHNLKVALKLTLKAKESAQKSIELAEHKNKQERYARQELERTDRLIEKALPIIKENDDPRAQDFFGKGVDWQEKAWELFRQKRFEAAIRNTQKARDFVLKALKIVEENVTPGMVGRAIGQNDDLINKVGTQIKVSGNQEAIQLFEEGLSHQEKAKEYLEDGKLKAALAQAKVAHRMITKAFDIIDKESL